MSKTRVRSLLIAGVLTGMAVLGIAAPAQAAIRVEQSHLEPAAVVSTSESALWGEPLSAKALGPISTANVTIPDTGGNSTKVDNSGDDRLPMNRWKGATGEFHSRFDQFMQNNAVDQAQREFVLKVAMAAGNGISDLTSTILRFALNLSIVNEIGHQTDKAVASLFNGLFKNSAILIAVVALALAVTMFRFARGQRQGAVKRLVVTAVAVGLIFLLGGGAVATTDKSFGFGSPGWILTKTSNTVTALADTPIKALLAAEFSDNSLIETGEEGTGTCSNYTDYLHQNYDEALSATASRVPGIMSSMWETTGLQVWKAGQYGTGAIGEGSSGTANGFADRVYCHQLEYQAGISASVHRKRTINSMGWSDTVGSEASLAWGAEDNDTWDRSLVAWAVCNTSNGKAFSVDSAASDSVSTADCEKWWSGADTELKAFNVSGTIESAAKFTEDAELRSFLVTLHGGNNTVAIFLVYLYIIVALIMGIIFGGFSIMVMIAKFASLGMGLAALFVLLMTVVKPDDTGKLAQFGKSFLGYTVLAFAASFVLSLIAFSTRVVSGFGDSMLGEASIGSLLWAGVSPVIACFLVSMVFKKFLKLPGVFKPSSAFAWGGAGAMAGGAMAQRMERRAEGRGRQVLSKAGNKVTSKLGLPGSERRGTMAESMAKGTGAAAGAGPSGPKVSGTAPTSKPNNTRAGFNKEELRQAKLVSKGFDVNNIPTASEYRKQRAASVAAAAGQKMASGIRAAGPKVERLGSSLLKGQIAAAQLKTPEGRRQMREQGAAALTEHKQRLRIGAAKVAQAGRDLRNDPEGFSRKAGFAASLAIEAGTKKVKEGVTPAFKATGRGLAAAGRSTWDATKTVSSKAADSLSASGPTMIKAAGVAAIGTVAAGPLGLVAAGAVVRRDIRRARHNANSQLVTNFREKREQQQQESKARAKVERKSTRTDRPAPSGNKAITGN